MPDVKEVYEMVTQQTPPNLGALERQNRKQRRRSARRKAGAYALVATLMVLAGILAVRSLGGNGARQLTPGSIATSTPTPVPTFGPMKPGTYVFSTLDPDFDASYRITMDIPDGYKGYGGYAVIKLGEIQGMSTWVVGNVYADPCHWRGTLLDPPVGSSVDRLVTALASQKGRHASTPTDVTVDGFAGKYMELTVPATIYLAECDGGEFRTWLGADGGERYLKPGQRDLLWIVDVDGTPLVIDAALGAETSAQDRAERIQIVNSVRIDPR